MSKRKSPKLHKVRQHPRKTKKGTTSVRQHLRGKGVSKTPGVVVKRLTFKDQEKMIKKILPGYVEYNDDYGQIETEADLDVFIKQMKKSGYKVKETKYWETDGVRAIATKPGFVSVVNLET